MCERSAALGSKYSEMKNQPQATTPGPGRSVRRFLREAIPLVVLVSGFAGAMMISWSIITRTPTAPGSKPRATPPETAFLSVAGAAVDLEVFAPDGRHTGTLGSPDSSTTIRDAQGHVDCDNYGDPKATEASCTASVLIRRPAFGDYRVIATSPDRRAETLTVGVGGDGFRRAGGFDVRVTLQPAVPVTFTVLVTEEGVSLRSQPRP